ncbi:MAG: NFACT RNA binding domain-containing protein [Candidatus Micrarchaeota archaeon]|nr:NFACT RNA binding domain-containing protein [Candidatus Micrarchaeota archaeon]
MKLNLDVRKTLLENTVQYREEAKKWRSKAQGAEKALLDTKKALEHQSNAIQQKIAAGTKTRREWFESFHHFRTSKGTLVVGGRNAKQNDTLFSKHCSKEEWFLHAEIRGAPAVVVKNPNASEEELQQAAQFAASYSSAWKREFGSIDVYAVRTEQVSKHFQGGYIDQGAFAIAGERKWFKNTLLGLYVCLDPDTLKISVKPAGLFDSAGGSGLCVKLLPGIKEKAAVSKAIKAYFAKKLFGQGKKVKLDEDEITKVVPGDSTVIGE